MTISQAGMALKIHSRRCSRLGAKVLMLQSGSAFAPMIEGMEGHREDLITQMEEL
jgi:hypothetical protein